MISINVNNLLYKILHEIINTSNLAFHRLKTNHFDDFLASAYLEVK